MNDYLINNMAIYKERIKDQHISKKESWGIYGTGDCAEIFIQIISELGIECAIKTVIDSDEKAEANIIFHGYKVKALSTVYEDLDGIIIAASKAHSIINERIRKYLELQEKRDIRIVDIFESYSKRELSDYVEYIERSYKDNKSFIDDIDEGIKIEPDDTKVIAWYLPQYFRNDVNDKNYGMGFTEWSNTTKAIPMFCGHNQPHIPYDVGFYNFDANEYIFRRQIELAQKYGVYGFSFYYYWFSGEKPLEKPIDLFLKNKELNINFCLTWANENWSKLWDGGNKELIFEQELKKGDDQKFANDIMKYFSDERYIRVNGKLIFIVYKVDIWTKERVKQFFKTLRQEVKKQGLGDLFILICNVNGFNDDNVNEWGGDGLVEFPPHIVGYKTTSYEVKGYINPNFKVNIHDMEEFINNKEYLMSHKENKNFYRGVFPNWDNTSRKAYSGANLYYGMNPEYFEKWLSDVIGESKSIHGKEDNIVFVNAWNEWAEGAHLEPDMKYGYANLLAVKKAIEKNR